MELDGRPIYGYLQYPHMDRLMRNNPYMDIATVISENLTAWMATTPALDTFKKVAAKSGVGFGTVQRAKNGDGNITVEKLTAIAAAFGRDPQELMTRRNLDGVANEPSPDTEMVNKFQTESEIEAQARNLASRAAEIARIWVQLPPLERDAYEAKLKQSVSTSPKAGATVPLKSPRRAAVSKNGTR